jgi:uncharacterized protein YpuA (DUF1002 family)
MNKTYTNITDVSTTNLLKMLDMDRFKDNAHQKMIQDELKFRNYNLDWNKQDEQIAFQGMIDAFRGV